MSNDARGRGKPRTTNIDEARKKFGEPPLQRDTRVFKLHCGDPVTIAQMPTTDDKSSASTAVIPELLDAVERLNIAKTFQTHAYSANQRLALDVRNNMDMFSRMKRDLESRVPHVSNAWLKGWELIYRFAGPLVSVLQKNAAKAVDYEETADGKPSVRVYHVAEFPGSILLSIVRYFEQHGIVDDWRASSYYRVMAAAHGSSGGARDESLNDSYRLFADHRDRWLMDGVINCGDMTRATDVAAHLAYYEKHGRALVFTSDLAIGGDTEYNNQEELNAVAHMGAMICALGGLAATPESIMILKYFSLASPLSVSLVALMAAKFSALYLVKPASSRPLNSEVYVVGVGYTGIDVNELSKLRMWHDWLSGKSHVAKYSVCENISPEFMRSHVRAETALMGVQESHLRYYERAFTIIREADLAANKQSKSADPRHRVQSREATEFREMCNQAKFTTTMHWRATVDFDRAMV